MIRKTTALTFTAVIIGGIALTGAGTGIAQAQTTPVVSCTTVVGPVLGIATGAACISYTAPFYTGSGAVLMGSGTEFANCADSTGVETDGLWSIVGSSCT